MSLKDTYNKIAADWFEDHKSDTWSYEGVKRFAHHLKPGSLVLDAGCGPGSKSDFLAKLGFKVVGIDFSDQFIKIAQLEYPGVEFEVMDMEDTSKLRSGFDGVMLLASLLHIPKQQVIPVLTALTQKMNAGGYLYIAVKETRGKEEDVITENDYGYDYQRFFSFYTMKELKGYVDRLGMELVDEFVTPVNKTNWLQVIARKK